MKKLLSLIAGAMLVLAFGLTYADESNDADKMIRDDDLLRYNLDRDQGTVNQMPAVPEAQGSGAGGVIRDPDNKSMDKDQGQLPVDKDTIKKDSPKDSWTEEPGPAKAPEEYPKYRNGY